MPPRPPFSWKGGETPPLHPLPAPDLAGLLLALPALAATPSPEPWLSSEATTVAAAFPPPPGAARIPREPGSYAAFLGDLPLKPPGVPALDFQGQPTSLPAARVVDWSVAGQSALQCADTALRLRATWQHIHGVSPMYHYTSGDLSRWFDWAAGTRPRVSGSSVTFVAHAAKADSSDTAFQAWLTNLYTYAGTRSLGLDTVAVTTPAPGDLLVTPGSPGHAVVLLDVATSGAHTYVLVGQGFLPATELHVVAGPVAGWYEVAGDMLDVQPIPMPWAGLRRWK